jgi:hypothetical protein
MRYGPDFFFWGYLKDKFYSNNPRTEELKESICREISNVPAVHLQKVNQNLFNRCEECLHVERGTAFSTPPVICEQR